MEALLTAVEPGLALLQNVKSKEAMAALLQDTFDCRFQGWTRDRRLRVREELALADEAAVEQLFLALRRLLGVSLAVGEQDTSALLEAAFSEGFPQKLRTRLVSALVAARPAWREASIQSLVSLPRLLSAECRVEATAASSAGGALGAPAAQLLLRVEGTRTRANELPEPRSLSVSLDRQSLAALVASATELRSRVEAVSRASAT